MSRMWQYTIFTLGLWLVSAELRRLFDWQFGFSNISVIAVLPILACIPHLIALTLGGAWRRLPGPLAAAAWCWAGGFSYALVLAGITGNVLPGCVAFAGFVFPIGVGLWIASEDVPRSVAIRRVTRVLFAGTTAVSIYGIIQYVVVPPWDGFWLRSVNAQGGPMSFGTPEPFAIRVFSTFSSPGPFAAFLACMLLLALPYLTSKRPWRLAQVALWLVALGLTFGRTGWLMFALGLAVYVFFATRRGTLLAAVAICVMLILGGLAIVPSAAASDRFTSGFLARFQTLSELGDDRSANDRRNLYAEGLGEFEAAPLGRGLGVIGLATKLGDAGRTTDFDSGILARMIEMGTPGALLLLAAFVGCFGTLLSGWAEARSREVGRQNAAAAAIAILAAIAANEFSGDVGGILALLLWLNVSLAFPPQRVPAGALISAAV